MQVCSSCGGHFVESQKLENIKRRNDRTASDLLNEIAAAQTNPETSRIRCPRCRGPMEAETRDTVDMDRCSQCNAYWLDAGELARYQLYFEVSDAGLEARAFQNRLENMTDAERHAYETMLQKLKWPEVFDATDRMMLSNMFDGLF